MCIARERAIAHAIERAEIRGGRSKSDRKDRKKKKKRERKKRKNCDRLGKSNYAINCHANAPALESITRLSKVFTRASILYCAAPEYLISPPPPAHETIRTITSLVVSKVGGRVGGVAISCTTCAVRGKQRSGTGDPGKRAENQSLNLLSSFHRFLSLSLSLSRPSLEKTEHAPLKKIYRSFRWVNNRNQR